MSLSISCIFIVDIVLFCYVNVYSYRERGKMYLSYRSVVSPFSFRTKLGETPIKERTTDFGSLVQWRLKGIKYALSSLELLLYSLYEQGRCKCECREFQPLCSWQLNRRGKGIRQRVCQSVGALPHR